ncbi:hypothetical protein GmHk_04G010935 [Glycine max]|nr:hypothetical protein GmHk_04G010935 [Glycine max]
MRTVKGEKFMVCVFQCEIWELNYVKFTVCIFKCKWVDSNTGVRTDGIGFTLVDLKKLGYHNDPFIMAEQARQVFYVQDPCDERLVVHVDPATGKADGPHKKKLRTYLGIVARDKVDVTYENWKEVPTAQKDLIWEDIQAEFDIPEASDSRTKRKTSDRGREMEAV